MMNAQRQFLVLLFFPALLIACNTPFVDIAIHTERDSQEYLDQNEEEAAALRPIPVAEFVRKRAVHGLTLAEMQSYGKNNREENVRILSDLLQKPNCGRTIEDGRVCSNIVATLGAIGGEPARKALKKFLSGKDNGYRDRTDTAKALGLWVNSSGDLVNDPTLKTLTEFARETIIENGNMRNRKPISKISAKIGKDDEGLDEELLQSLRELRASKPNLKNNLVQSTISGLVFAGGPRKELMKSTNKGPVAFFTGLPKKLLAKLIDNRNSIIVDTLTELANETASSENTDKVSLRSFVIQALREHKKVVQAGLDCYCQQGRQSISKQCKEKLALSDD